jgi:hypothetical protein
MAPQYDSAPRPANSSLQQPIQFKSIHTKSLQRSASSSTDIEEIDGAVIRRRADGARSMVRAIGANDFLKSQHRVRSQDLRARIHQMPTLLDRQFGDAMAGRSHGCKRPLVSDRAR